jgi:hypothetical protein
VAAPWTIGPREHHADARLARLGDHVRGAPAARERHHEVGLALGEHPGIAHRPGGAAVLGPVRRECLDGDPVPLAVLPREPVGAGRPALDDDGDREAGEVGVERRPVGIVPAATLSPREIISRDIIACVFRMAGLTLPALPAHSAARDHEGIGGRDPQALNLAAGAVHTSFPAADGRYPDCPPVSLTPLQAGGHFTSPEHRPSDLWTMTKPKGPASGCVKRGSE